MSSPVLSREQLAKLTVEALEAGQNTSTTIRSYIADKTGIVFESKNTNLHAWALVDLQARKTIFKIGKGAYRLAYGSPANEFLVEPPTIDDPPKWAKDLVARTKRFAKVEGSRFSMADLVAIWQRCGGRCEVTGGQFSNRPIGRGLVKRAYAPSLDRIDPEKPYVFDNCRLVMVAINFAMNTWGEDTFLQLAKLTTDTRR